MPSFPQPGSVTICEINRDIITSESLSEEKANETYSKLLGVVFRPLPFHPDQLLSWRSEQGRDQLHGRSEMSLITKALRVIKTGSLDSVSYLNFLPEVDIQGVSWHQHKHIVALLYGRHQVMVHDYEDQAEGKDYCILSSESQREVRALQWRPNGGKSLAVACKGGICIWAASYPGNVATARSVASYSGTPFRGSGARWLLVDFLRCQDDQINLLSWSPDGRYLASASHESSSFTIWDVAQGVGTPIRRGLGGITMLKWSPTGDYFFAAKFDGSFYLWETNTWASEPWSSTTGFVTGASWDPDGGRILIAFSGSSTLASIHFASKPPSLDAHLLPVDLPELVSLTGSQGIERLAWDASGERLAVSFKGGYEMFKGLVVIYDTRRTPLVTASLIGFIRGPGENPKPVAFSFHNKFKQGPLLSVCWSSGFCCTYPLICHSQGLP